jgi:hypothetical protein
LRQAADVSFDEYIALNFADEGPTLR